MVGDDAAPSQRNSITAHQGLNARRSLAGLQLGGEVFLLTFPLIERSRSFSKAAGEPNNSAHWIVNRPKPPTERLTNPLIRCFTTEIIPQALQLAARADPISHEYRLSLHRLSCCLAAASRRTVKQTLCRPPVLPCAARFGDAPGGYRRRAASSRRGRCPQTSRVPSRERDPGLIG